MSTTFHGLESIQQAETRIRPYIRQTLLDHSPYYSQRTEDHNTSVYFKCENLQHTGSFKARGALNKILSLNDDESQRGIITASSGNHGAACAFAMQKVGVKGIVYVPETASETKIAAIRRLGAEVRLFGTDGLDTELEARAQAKANGMTFISPYNDAEVVAGQGTIGPELLVQLPDTDMVYLAVGGGGLIGGVAAALKALKPSVEVIGCSPVNSQVMAESVAAGEILDLPSLPTLSDGTAGGVEPESITFPLCRDLVDRYVSVTEEEIAQSLREFMGTQHMLIEGAAAVAIAAFVQECAVTPKRFAEKNVVIVLCGANISLKTLADVLNGA
ncbi:MAG: threonine/serine dehydratase [Chloroflexota bacterium]